MPFLDKLGAIKERLGNVEEDQQTIDDILNSQSNFDAAIEEEEEIISRIDEMEKEIYSLIAGPEHVLANAENLLEYEKFVLTKAREISTYLGKTRRALENENPEVDSRIYRIMDKTPVSLSEPWPELDGKSPVHFLEQAAENADEVRQKREELLGQSSEEVVDAVEFLFLSDKPIEVIEEIKSLIEWVEGDERKMEKVARNLGRKSEYRAIEQEESQTQELEEKLSTLVEKEEEIKEMRNKLNQLKMEAESDDSGIDLFLRRSQSYQGESGEELNSYLLEEYDVGREFEEKYKELMEELQHMRDSSEAVLHASENPRGVIETLLRDFAGMGLAGKPHLKRES